MVEVRIPPGARNGSRLRVPGKGNAGTMGAPPGDLYITTKVEEHPFFHREGDNIEITVPVAVWEAALGAKIEVPTIDGRTLLKIPQGTTNGQKFRSARERAFSTRAPISAATRLWKWPSRRPIRATNARANCCAKWPSCIPKTRAPNCGPKSDRSFYGTSEIQSGFHDLGGGRTVRCPPADPAPL
jgi:hypothetical protein